MRIPIRSRPTTMGLLDVDLWLRSEKSLYRTASTASRIFTFGTTSTRPDSLSGGLRRLAHPSFFPRFFTPSPRPTDGIRTAKFHLRDYHAYNENHGRVAHLLVGGQRQIAGPLYGQLIPARRAIF